MGESYHHGDLRRALLDEAAIFIAQVGPASASLRELARRTGVSHAAPTHHFGDRRGLLTALATEGLQGLANALESATSAGFDEAAVAYVRFARDHPGHYAVMYRPELLHADDAQLIAARAATTRALAQGVASIPPERRSQVTADEAALTAWALVHGLVSLAAQGAIGDRDLEALTRRAAHQLFGEQR